MISDGIHADKAYEDLGALEEFDSACHIYDKTSGISLSGVLISPTVVMTAAHGVLAMLKSRNGSKKTEKNIVPLEGIEVFFKTHNKKIHVSSKAVAFDLRYTEFNYGMESHHDIAFIKLDHPIISIRPAVFFDDGYISGDIMLYALTWSTSDHFFSLGTVLPYFFEQSPVRRSFCLLEYDIFYPSSLDGNEIIRPHSFLISSLFFDPFLITSTTQESSYIDTRNEIARQRWLKENKPPFGLAISGTSGGPVFAYTQGKYRLLGIVVSFAPTKPTLSREQMDPKRLTLLPKTQLYRKFQTVIALCYQKSPDPNRYKKDNLWIQFDPYHRSLIQKLTWGE